MPQLIMKLYVKLILYFPKFVQVGCPISGSRWWKEDAAVKKVSDRKGIKPVEPHKEVRYTSFLQGWFPLADPPLLGIPSHSRVTSFPLQRMLLPLKVL